MLPKEEVAKLKGLHEESISGISIGEQHCCYGRCYAIFCNSREMGYMEVAAALEETPGVPSQSVNGKCRLLEPEAATNFFSTVAFCAKYRPGQFAIHTFPGCSLHEKSRVRLCVLSRRVA